MNREQIRREVLEEVAEWYASTRWFLDEDDVPAASISCVQGNVYTVPLYTHPAPLDAERVREVAIREAAQIVAKRRDEYVREHGMTDPETGTVEFPGNGEEWVGEWEEIEEAILAALHQKEGGQ